jgi:futalosine hydrolase
MRQIDSERPALIVQAGIAGCLTDRPPGEVVVADEDQFADQGVWEEGRFKSLFDMRLADRDAFPFTRGQLVNPYPRLLARTALPRVGALTVNEITTNPERISWYQQNTAAVVESMEGAAFHYACLQKSVPFLQLRSVSNAVGVRDKKKWDIRLAIARLNEALVRLMTDPALEKELDKI